jgi:hypothetical protein
MGAGRVRCGDRERWFGAVERSLLAISGRGLNHAMAPMAAMSARLGAARALRRHWAAIRQPSQR